MHRGNDLPFAQRVRKQAHERHFPTSNRDAENRWFLEELHISVQARILQRAHSLSLQMFVEGGMTCFTSAIRPSTEMKYSQFPVHPYVLRSEYPCTQTSTRSNGSFILTNQSFANDRCLLAARHRRSHVNKICLDSSLRQMLTETYVA